MHISWHLSKFLSQISQIKRIDLCLAGPCLLFSTFWNNYLLLSNFFNFCGCHPPSSARPGPLLHSCTYLQNIGNLREREEIVLDSWHNFSFFLLLSQSFFSFKSAQKDVKNLHSSFKELLLFRNKWIHSFSHVRPMSLSHLATPFLPLRLAHLFCQLKFASILKFSLEKHWEEKKFCPARALPQIVA